MSLELSFIDRKECPICGQLNFETYIPFPAIPVLQCGNCDFKFSGKILSAQTMKEYYECNFGSERHRQGQEINSIINSHVLSKLVHLQFVRNILDVGAGYGFLLEALRRKHGFEEAGVELSRQEAQYAKDKLKLNVLNSSLRDSGLPKGAFDLVTSFEVIEHVSDPVHFIMEMAQYVRPGGFAVIMTDNFDSRVAKALGAGFPKWIPHSHISHFSPSTFARAVNSHADLRIIKAMTYSSWEMKLRSWYYKLRGINKSPVEAFDLEDTLKTEMNQNYRLFRIRKLISTMWVKASVSENMEGDLMYFVIRRNM